MTFRARRFQSPAIFGAAAGGGGGAYVGPGDITAAVWWGGLRAYNAAYATSLGPAVDLVDQTGANTLTVNIKSDGTLDVASISTWVTAHTVTTIKVTKLYDQSGGLLDGVQSTLANMPTLVLGPVTGLAANRPAMQFSGGQLLATVPRSAGTVNQPITLSAVTNRTGAITAQSGIGDAQNGNLQMCFGTSTSPNIYGGTGPLSSGTITNNAWHAVQGIINGASSLIDVDGVDGAAGNAGATTWTTGNLSVGTDGFGNFLTGFVNEFGVFNLDFTAASKSGPMSSQQKTYWGY